MVFNDESLCNENVTPNSPAVSKQQIRQMRTGAAGTVTVLTELVTDEAVLRIMKTPYRIDTAVFAVLALASLVYAVLTLLLVDGAG